MKPKHLNQTGSRLLTCVIIACLSGCAAFTEHSTGLIDGRLTDCPKWPRCVNSQAEDSSRHIEPYQIRDDVIAAWRKAVDAVAVMPRTTIVDKQHNYLRAEVISPWHVYTDDLELLLEPDKQIIQVRSSGRIGYYDFNVNRDRVEALRDDLVRLGVMMRK